MPRSSIVPTNSELQHCRPRAEQTTTMRHIGVGAARSSPGTVSQCDASKRAPGRGSVRSANHAIVVFSPRMQRLCCCRYSDVRRCHSPVSGPKTTPESRHRGAPRRDFVPVRRMFGCTKAEFGDQCHTHRPARATSISPTRTRTTSGAIRPMFGPSGGQDRQQLPPGQSATARNMFSGSFFETDRSQ